MKIQRLAVILTVINFMLLVFLVSQRQPATAQGVTPVLRGKALEIVDDQGKVRAFLGVLPANPTSRGSDGQTFPETVILRLMDPRTGRPSVKLATSEQGSGLGLLGESRTAETWAGIGADGTTSAVRLRNEGRPEQLIQR
jgi:hypothetical protein